MPHPQFLNVSLGTNHKVYKLSKKWYLIFTIIGKGIYLLIGLYVSNRLYKECLFNPGCNPAVTIYFCVLGLSCFINLGLPIDRLASLKFFSG